MYVTVPATSETEPCVSPTMGSTEMTVRVWPDSFAGPAESLAVRSEAGKLTEPSSATDLESPLAVGASLTSDTVTETVAVSDLKSLTPFVVPLSVAV